MEIIRSIAERRVRTSLAIGGILVGVLVLTLTGAMAEHFTAHFAGGVAYYSSTIQVADDAGGYAGLVALSKLDAIQRVPGVAAALPTISILARPGTVPTVPLALPDTIVYSDPRERQLSPLKTALASGRQLDPNRQGEVVLGAGVAGELHLQVGDRVELPVRPRGANQDFVNHPFKVVGVLKPTNTLPDATAAIGLLDAQTLLQESLPASFRDRVDPSSLATGITVYGKPHTDLDKLADRINASVAGVAATRPSDFVRNFDQSTRFTTLAFAAAAVAVLFGALLLTDTMLAAAGERAREIALKLALGARGWQVAAELLIEAAAIALAGGLLGLMVGFGVAQLLDLAGRSIGMDVFLVTGRLARIALALTVALGLGTGLVPALRAARTDPDLALRGATP